MALCLFWSVGKPHTLHTWAPMTSENTGWRSLLGCGGVNRLVCNSEVAEGPQLSLTNCRNTKVEGKTHTYSWTDIWRRERGMSVTSELPQETWRSPKRRRLLSRSAGRAKEREWRNSLAYYFGIGHSSGCWLNLIISTCERKVHCSYRKAKCTGCTGERKVVKKRPGMKFILRFLSHETHPLLWIRVSDGQRELQFNTLHFNPSSNMQIFNAECFSYSSQFKRGHRLEMATEVTAHVVARLHYQKNTTAVSKNISSRWTCLLLGSPLDVTNLEVDIRSTAQFPWVMMLITSILKEQSKFTSFPSVARLHSRLSQGKPMTGPWIALDIQQLQSSFKRIEISPLLQSSWQLKEGGHLNSLL